MSYVQYIWILLSILVSITCSFCFMQPEWIMHVNFTNTFGIYTYCVSQRAGMDTRACGFYGGRFGFGNIPSTTWQAACLLYGGGCLFTCFGALCSLATMCVRTQLEMTLVMSTRYLQTSAVFLMASGLLVFPMSFESNYFRLYCGTKSAILWSTEPQRHIELSILEMSERPGQYGDVVVDDYPSIPEMTRIK
ncbi:hypothetical protein DPMN_010182 [Dreissena polymorpha]|uniref:Uncharacterized protein n=1 Tax=Dreissena polymorpha TaxID=45954 RepID=A0A9D4N1T2_DREPO|nr:hypothetical protein DPMN_010182 [Dreissena polymorpha]